MSNRTKLFRKLALFGYFGLLFWVIYWHFVFPEESEYSVGFRFFMWVVPLLLPLKGIVQGKPYTHAWANFIIMFYLLHGLTAIYAVADEWFYALVEIVLASIMFVGCAFFARLRGKELGLGLKKLNPDS